MMTAGFPLERGRQVLLDTEVLRHLKRTIGPPSKDLLCYYAPETQKFCVAVWRDRVSGFVSEILSYTRAAKFTRADVGFVRYFLSDQRRRDNMATRRKVWEGRRKRLRDRNDARREAENVRESWRRTLNIHIRDHPAAKYAQMRQV